MGFCVWFLFLSRTLSAFAEGFLRMSKSTTTTTSTNKRIYFKEEKEILPLPDLAGIQKDSYERFLREGVEEILKEINPVEDYTGKRWELTFSSPSIKDPKSTVEEALEKRLTYSAPWFLKATVAAKDPNTVSGKKSITEEVYMGDIPLMTTKGTFLVNGNERVIVNQLRRSEGVYYSGELDPSTDSRLSSAKIIPRTGAWLELSTSKNNVLTLRINRYRKFPATTVLRLFGLRTDEEIIEAFSAVNSNEDRDYIRTTLEKDAASNYEEAVLEVFKKIRPGEPLVLDNAKAVVEDLFFNPRRYDLGEVGRFKLNLIHDLDIPNDDEHRLLTRADLIKIFSRVIDLNNGVGDYTDTDDLSNRRVRTVGELVQDQMRIGFLQTEKHIKERMTLQSGDVVPSPSSLISPRPVEARVHSFFSSNQLSQYHDQTNILAGLDHLRRLSVGGPGGLSEERASFSVRDAHYSHYGRICAVRTPEGPKIGLVTYLALYSRVNEYGFLETPYRKLDVAGDGKVKVTDKVDYLPAYEEHKYSITDASVRTDSKGYIIDKLVPLRHKGEFYIGQAQEASYMDLVPRQLVGVSASLVPFVAHNDPPRALMASNMQTQAVPLLLPKAPLVGTGMESDIAKNTGANIYAPEEGVISYVDASRVELKGKSGKSYKYSLAKFIRSNNDTDFSQSPAVTINQKIGKGDLLADGSSMEQGELALGANPFVAYMSWYGYGYEDAIIISERLVRDDVLSSVHISEHTVQVMETKLGPEEVTRDIPNVSEESLRNLDENGVVHLGAKVKSGDILVGKIAPKGETELTAEERLLRAIFGEKAREVRDNSLKVPHGEYGTVIGIYEITKEDNDELSAGVIKELTIRVAQVRKIMVGDKLAGRHGNKGVISKIVPEEDLPHLEDGTPVDIIISPVNVIGRMNVGQMLETHLSWAGQKLGKTYAVPVFEQFDEDSLLKELEKAGLPTGGKAKLIDGRTGEYFDREIVVGYPHILKLLHLSEDKIHARSTGPYSLITQQPLGGKAQFGGQRFGEMEVWALEAYSAAYILQEMLTIKSDDLVGRTRAYRAIITGQRVPEPGIPESFKLLVRELNGLGLDIETIGEIESPEIEEEIVESLEAIVEEVSKEEDNVEDIEEIQEGDK
jgi:DNA-directed RNA polymerase subunit beta